MPDTGDDDDDDSDDAVQIGEYSLTEDGSADTIAVNTGGSLSVSNEQGIIGPPPRTVSVDSAADDILGQLDDMRAYLDNDPDATEDLIKGFEAARYIVRAWHLRNTVNVTCVCDGGPDPEMDEDDFWVCAECNDLLMTPAEDERTGPMAGV